MRRFTQLCKAMCISLLYMHVRIRYVYCVYNIGVPVNNTVLQCFLIYGMGLPCMVSVLSSNF